MKRFGLIGAAGYIAPRHMTAIAQTGNDLVVAYDTNDSVGIIDSHFPDADYFTEFELFDSHIDRLARRGSGLEYISIASPNYLHEAHMRYALRSGCTAICEKPIVLWPEELEGLIRLQEDLGGEVNTILQLRLHPSIIELRDRLEREAGDKKRDVDLTYITSRGQWYLKSWKADDRKSGGIATNIGVHFFDMLHYLFGELQENVVHLAEPTRSAGFLEFAGARVRWYLSLEVEDVPEELRAEGQRTFRSITVNGDEMEFSGGFTDLHTRSYEEILKGNGFGLAANRTAIEAVTGIRTGAVVSGSSKSHPMAHAAR